MKKKRKKNERSSFSKTKGKKRHQRNDDAFSCSPSLPPPLISLSPFPPRKEHESSRLDPLYWRLTHSLARFRKARLISSSEAEGETPSASNGQSSSSSSRALWSARAGCGRLGAPFRRAWGPKWRGRAAARGALSIGARSRPPSARRRGQLLFGNYFVSSHSTMKKRIFSLFDSSSFKTFCVDFLSFECSGSPAACSAPRPRPRSVTGALASRRWRCVFLEKSRRGSKKSICFSSSSSSSSSNLSLFQPLSQPLSTANPLPPSPRLLCSVDLPRDPSRDELLFFFSPPPLQRRGDGDGRGGAGAAARR